MASMLYLLLMSLIAGVLNGIVGMAALTLYPVLLSIGIAPVSANATITISQMGSGIGTLLSSFKELKHHWKQAILIALINTSAGILGALLLIHSSDADFKKVVPLFILLAAIMILLPKKQREGLTKSPWVKAMGWISIFLVGLYIGYFGAGSGLLMIAVLSRALNEKYATYNAIRNFATFLNNGVAGILFAFTMPVHWVVIPILLVGLFAGGFLGPIVVRHVPQNKIERYVGIFALVLSTVLAWQAWGWCRKYLCHWGLLFDLMVPIRNIGLNFFVATAILRAWSSWKGYHFFSKPSFVSDGFFIWMHFYQNMMLV